MSPKWSTSLFLLTGNGMQSLDMGPSEWKQAFQQFFRKDLAFSLTRHTTSCFPVLFIIQGQCYFWGTTQQQIIPTCGKQHASELTSFSFKGQLVLSRCTLSQTYVFKGGFSLGILNLDSTFFFLIYLSIVHSFFFFISHVIALSHTHTFITERCCLNYKKDK